MSAAVWHFAMLSRDQQAAAIRRLAAVGQSEYTIATATGLSVEMVRRILADGATWPVIDGQNAFRKAWRGGPVIRTERAEDALAAFKTSDSQR